MARVMASVKNCCWMTLAARVPSSWLLPENPLESWEVAGWPLVRSGAVSGKPAACTTWAMAGARGTPPVRPVESSRMMVSGAGTAPLTGLPWVTSWMRTGPSLPTATVLKPWVRA